MTELDIRIKLCGDALASEDELSLRHRFQEEIESRGIGKDLGGGSGFGEMDVSVEVADVETAKNRLRALTEELGIDEPTVIDD